MKKLLTVAAIGLLSSLEVFAADVGLGVDLNSGSNTVYVPINLANGIRIEPYFSTYKYTNENNYSYDYRVSTLGAGVFKVSEAANNTNIFWGARAGYIDGKSYDGYSVAPVLGFEYYLVKNLSLGADVSLEYEHINDVNDSSSTKTKTSLGVKYFFN
jgi:hypothetical protein